MRRLPLRVWSIAMVAAAGALLACVSGDNARPPGVDAGPLPLGDSGPLPAGPDATVPGTDAGVDTGDAAPSPLVLHVLLNGAPEANVAVIFEDATGAVITSATTDATGTVTRSVGTGEQLTALFGSASQPSLVTVQQVAMGDVITLLDPSSTPSSFDDQLSVTTPVPDFDAAGGSITASAGSCGDPLPNTINVYGYCIVNGRYPLFVRATDSTGNELAYTFQNGNDAYTDGGTPDGGSIAFVVTRPWSVSSAAQTITASLPAPPAGLGSTPTIQYAYTEIADQVPLRLVATQTSTSDAGVPTSVFTMHPGYPDATQTEGSVAFHDVAFTAEIAAATRAGVATTSQSVSMDLTTLPFLTAAHIDGADAGTAAQPITTWTTESAAPATTAGVGVAFTWTSTPLDGGSSVYGSWTILAPPSATSVRAPALPASDSDYVPASNAVYGVTPQVALLQGSAVPSYAVLRAQFGALLPLFSGGSSLEMPPLAADGTLAVSVVYPTP